MDFDGLSLQDVVSKVLPNRSTILEVINDVETAGKVLKVTHVAEKPAPQEPVEAPAKKRAHVFNDVKGLADYLQKYATDSTVVLGDVETLEAKISLADQDGSGGFEILTYKPVFHPAFATWMKIVGRTLPVLEFASFVMANRRFVEHGKNMALLFSQMRMSKSIEIAQGNGKKAINGGMVTVEIQGTRTEKFEELPETLVINVPVFLQSVPTRVELDLLVSEVDNEIVIAVSASDVEVVMANQFIEDIRNLEALVPDINCTFGKIGFKEGDFLRP